MDKSYFRCLFRPELESPVFVEGIPGLGNVGRIAARLLIKFTQAKLFAEMYSPLLPDYVVVNVNGICHLPRYEFYTASVREKHFIILTGDAHPPHEDVLAHYELCGDILDFVKDYGCRFVVTMDGTPRNGSEGEVYVAATSRRLASTIAEMGATIYKGRELAGITGLMLGLAKSRGWKGVCLLGATTGVGVDRQAAFSVFKVLTKMLGIEKAQV